MFCCHQLCFVTRLILLLMICFSRFPVLKDSFSARERSNGSVHVVGRAARVISPSAQSDGDNGIQQLEILESFSVMAIQRERTGWQPQVA